MNSATPSTAVAERDIVNQALVNAGVLDFEFPESGQSRLVMFPNGPAGPVLKITDVGQNRFRVEQQSICELEENL